MTGLPFHADVAVEVRYGLCVQSFAGTRKVRDVLGRRKVAEYAFEKLLWKLEQRTCALRKRHVELLIMLGRSELGLDRSLSQRRTLLFLR